jgi:hypothetical protein
MAFLTMEAGAFADGMKWSRFPPRFLVDPCGLANPFDVILEPPRMALRSPVRVPKTCPQSVVFLGNGRGRDAKFSGWRLRLLM